MDLESEHDWTSQQTSILGRGSTRRAARRRAGFRAGPRWAVAAAISVAVAHSFGGGGHFSGGAHFGGQPSAVVPTSAAARATSPVPGSQATTAGAPTSGTRQGQASLPTDMPPATVVPIMVVIRCDPAMPPAPATSAPAGMSVLGRVCSPGVYWWVAATATIGPAATGTGGSGPARTMAGASRCFWRPSLWPTRPTTGAAFRTTTATTSTTSGTRTRTATS